MWEFSSRRRSQHGLLNLQQPQKKRFRSFEKKRNETKDSKKMKALALLLLAQSGPLICAFVPGVPFMTARVRSGQLKAKTSVSMVKAAQSSEEQAVERQYCIPLEEIGLDDLPKVGG